MVAFSGPSRGLLAHAAFLGLALGASAASAQAQPKLRTVIGAPYQASGLWWVPAVQPNYEAVGEARVAPPALRTREVGDDLTAAHATLPLPSLVDVTNLDTGRTARLRLTERGAAAPGRLLDLSPASARALGVEGAARIRVKLVSGPAAPRHAAVSAPPLRGMATASQAPSAFSVQAGAFGERQHAERAALHIASAGRAEVSATERDGKRLWRVSMPAADAAGAETARARIVALGFADARIVRGS